MTDVRVGATLPGGRGGQVASRSTAQRVKKPTVRETNRGVEVTVKVPATGKHVVVVRS